MGTTEIQQKIKVGAVFEGLHVTPKWFLWNNKKTPDRPGYVLVEDERGRRAGRALRRDRRRDRFRALVQPEEPDLGAGVSRSGRGVVMSVWHACSASGMHEPSDFWRSPTSPRTPDSKI